MDVTGRNWLCLCLILVGYLSRTGAEVFTAMADMENLLHTEKHVVTVIDQYINSETKRLERLKEFAKDYQIRNQEALRLGGNYISNPVNAYVLIKRLTSDWSTVENMMRYNAAEDYLKNITSQRDSVFVKFPDQEDLDGAATALMRLQDTYKLDTRDIAEGHIQGVQKTETLDAHACFEIGRIAYNQKDYYHTLMWMEEANARMIRENPPTVQEWEILEYLAFAMFQQGNVKRALRMTKRLLKLNPENPRAHGNIVYYEDQLAKVSGKKSDDGELPPIVNERKIDYSVNERNTYEALCRGEQFKSNLDLSKLKCYFKRDTPFLRLAPLKMEVLHYKPKIVLFRDVVSDNEIAIIKELAAPRLKRATVHNKVTGQLEFASYRISKSAWLKDRDHAVVARVSKRINQMTGLEMSTAEDLQIANYGIGGHYDPHYDFARKEETKAFDANIGNRIATALFYLSQPEAGGATVFPELKLTLYPSKNDAVFWHNLWKSGEGDLTTRHAACPVLAGIKWVSNKWIHERGQEFNRPCDKEEDSYE